MSGFSPSAPGTATHFTAITPSDTTVYSPPLTQIYVGGSGAVAVMGQGDTVAATFAAVPVGGVITGNFKKVMATNTTATLMIGGALMPLEHGSSNATIGRNIATEMHNNRPQKQAVAIAMNVAGRSRRDDCPQHGYMDACTRGDAEGMRSACDTMLRGRVVR